MSIAARALSLLALCCCAHAVAAQAADRLVGVYDMQSGEPLADVQIILLGTQLQWRTSTAGMAMLRNLPSGDQLLRLRRIGYAPHSEFVTFSWNDTTPMTMVLKPLSIALPEVMVTAREERYALKLNGFLERRRATAAPASSFITEADLARYNVTRWTDALARTSGVHSDIRGRISLRGCGTFALFLDGVLLADNDLEMIPVNTVAAIEVYRGAAQIPAQFNVTKRACGAVVVWTK